MNGSSKSGFKSNVVSGVYAQALFELAEQAGTLEVIAGQLDQIGRILAGQPDLVRLISNRAMGRDDRAGLIDRLFKDKVDDTLYRFLRVLNDKSRLAELPSLTAAFADLMLQKRGVVEAQVFVAQPLEPAEADRIATSIGRVLGKEVLLQTQVDPSLIGGLAMRIGDRMIDGSVATKLANMKRDLIAAGREHARRQVAVRAQAPQS